MSWSLILVQSLNGIQLGIMLFLIAAGLTLIFGIMDFVNLAHGTFYMLGAFVAATFFAYTGSYVVAAVFATIVVAIVGLLLEVSLLRFLYTKSHLQHVLATFGLILVINDVTRLIWGAAPKAFPVPEALSGFVEIMPGVTYPVYRLLILAVGLVVAGLLYVLVSHTRAGMWVRAGASDRDMAAALGINVKRVFSYVFALGAGLAGIAGLMTGPILAVQIGMGEQIIILALVVMVIGGIGSVRGAFLASLFIGLADTFGRVLLPTSLSSMTIFVIMALVLTLRPKGLFSLNV